MGVVYSSLEITQSGNYWILSFGPSLTKVAILNYWNLEISSSLPFNLLLNAVYRTLSSASKFLWKPVLYETPTLFTIHILCAVASDSHVACQRVGIMIYVPVGLPLCIGTYRKRNKSSKKKRWKLLPHFFLFKFWYKISTWTFALLYKAYLILVCSYSQCFKPEGIRQDVL